MRIGPLSLTVFLWTGVFSQAGGWTSMFAAQVTSKATRTQTVRPVAHPAETAMILAALMRYADGKPDGSMLDQQLALRLNRLPNARAAVKRWVAGFARLTLAERQARLPGVSGLDRVQAVPFVRSRFAVQAGAFALPKAQVSKPIVDILPAQTVKPGQIEEYRLDYTGLSCVKAADAANRDKPVAFTTMITHPGGPQVPYNYDSRSFPPQGSLSGITSGMASAANAGPVWTAESFYTSGWDPGYIFVSALLMDDGTLEAQKEDMGIVYATAETVASTVDGNDRITPLFTGLTYALGVLHLGNPDRWATQSVVARIYSVSNHNAYSVQTPNSTAGIPWRIEVKHNTRGADYSLLYNVPSVVQRWARVKVSLVKIAAEGAVKDKENGLADFVTEIQIGLLTSATREFGRDHNQLVPAYSVLRNMFPGQKAPITIKLYERDAPPELDTWAPLLVGKCEACGVWEVWNNLTEYQEGGNCIYTGPCPPVFHECDLNLKPNVTSAGGEVSNTRLTISFDLDTGAIRGDLWGSKGQVLTARGDPAHERRAMIQFRVD